MASKKTETQLRIENYKKVINYYGAEVKQSMHKHVLSVGDLKKILAQIDDDSMPVFLEMFSDEYTSTEFPLFAATTTGTSIPDSNIGYDILVLQSVEDDSYNEWKKEDNGSWSDSVLGRNK